MPTFLEVTASPITQYLATRRNGASPTGTTVIHTYECPWTWTLEQGARGIALRTDRPASYHALAGAQSPTSVMQMAPWSAETWHETTTNNWAVGISMLTYAARWADVPQPQRDNLVKSAAYAAHMYAQWLKANRGITIPARRITRAQALNREPGFIGHGDVDTLRRTDPGAGFDWNLFLATFAAYQTDSPVTAAQEDDMFSDQDRAEMRIMLGALRRIDPRVATIGNNTALTNKALGDVAGRVKALNDADPVSAAELAPLVASQVATLVTGALADVLANRDGGLTPAEWESITERAVRSVFADAAKEA